MQPSNLSHKIVNQSNFNRLNDEHLKKFINHFVHMSIDILCVANQTVQSANLLKVSCSKR